MMAGNPEDAFDTILVSHADLDVRLTPEAGVWIEKAAFGKEAAHGVEGRFTGALAELMQIVDNHAVQFPVKKIITARIFWKLPARCRKIGFQIFISVFNRMAAI